MTYYPIPYPLDLHGLTAIEEVQQLTVSSIKFEHQDDHKSVCRKILKLNVEKVNVQI